MSENMRKKEGAGRRGHEGAIHPEAPGVEMAASNASTETPGFEHRWRLFDMHCHLDRMANADEVAREAVANDMALFCTTVTPADALAARSRFGTPPNVRVGVGLHPWWIADGRCGEIEIEQAAQLAAASRFIGEVGLDFGPRHAANAQRQLDALEAIARACAGHPVEGRVLSIHAVRSAGEALDVFERHGLTASAHCIFHWFSGTSDQLARALDAGCLFSISERMLATRRGREYARQIPLDRLLLETDLPEQLDKPCSADQVEASLMRALHELAHIRGTDEHALSTRIAKTSSGLLGLQPRPSYRSNNQWGDL
ncbi:putative metal-dependent hydrolase YcfH [Collinsella intestinalis]|nr:putative metal-dependent hydrolase YcfH [Collinsella intestinalis]